MLVGRLMKAELVEDAGHVTLDGGHGDHQLVRDAGIGAAFGDQRRDPSLAWARSALRVCFPLAANAQCAVGDEVEHRG